VKDTPAPFSDGHVPVATPQGSTVSAAGDRDSTLPVARPIGGFLPEAGGSVGKGLIAGDELLLSTSTARRAALDVLRLVLLLAALELAGSLALEVFVESSGSGVSVDGRERRAPQGIAEDAETQFPRSWFVPLIGFRGVGSILIVMFLLRHRRQSVRTVGLNFGSFPLNVVVGLGALMMTYVSIFSIMPLMSMVFPEAIKQMEENAETLMGLVPRLSMAGFLGVAVMIGVYEELLFRGFLMTRLRRATGSWIAAVLISTAAFTALHSLDQEPTALVWVTMLSLIFSGVTIWRRSIVPAIVAHALFDFSQFVGMAYQAGDRWR